MKKHKINIPPQRLNSLGRPLRKTQFSREGDVCTDDDVDPYTDADLDGGVDPYATHVHGDSVK